MRIRKKHSNHYPRNYLANERVVFGSFFYVLSVILLLLTACGSPSKTNEPSPFIGLNTPIILSDTTEVIWADYVWEPANLKVAKLPPGIQHIRINEERSRFIGRLQQPVEFVELLVDDEQGHILLKNSGYVTVSFSYPDSQRSVELVQLKGEMNGWNAAANPMHYRDGAWWVEMKVESGVYAYKFVVDGIELIDPVNPRKAPNGFGDYNSVIEVGQRSTRPAVLLPTEANGSRLSFRMESYLPLDQSLGQFSSEQSTSTSGKEDEIPNQFSTNEHTLLVMWENEAVEVQEMGAYWELEIPARAAFHDRSHLRLWLTNEVEVLHNMTIPLQNGQIVQKRDDLKRSDRSAWNMYFVFLDRFKDGNSQNNRQVDDPEIHPSVNYYGGDLQGLIEVIKTGYFDSLSVNTLWLSPIIQNPEGAYGLWDQGGVRSTFSGYHGYWPISSSRIDDRMGTKEDLKELLELAHDREMNILLDYVANHVHEEHPVMEQHPEWKTDLYLPDGTMNTQLWDEQRLTTWFDTFMPSLDFSQEAVVEAMSDSALYWIQEFDIDGFRHDATKHIPLEFWRTLTQKINQEVKGNPGRSFYQIGETYGSRPLIASYVRSGLLDAQFDFSLFDAVQASFGQNQSLHSLAEQLRESVRYYGMSNQMGVISGNHDKARFISLASGDVRWNEDAKLAAWTRDIPHPKEEGHARLQLMHTWMFTVPGIPVTYYGDEFGLPGANDPDNRRPMKFEGLSALEQQSLSHYTSMARLRANHLALQYGSLRFESISDEVLIYERAYFNESVWVFFNMADHSELITFEHPFTGESISVELPPLSSLVQVFHP